MVTTQADAIAEEIIGLYQKHGGAEYSGERISQREHMIQTAQLAEDQGHDNEIILAAFLHDIGHICVSAGSAPTMDGLGVMDHEEIGAKYLKSKGFSKRIVRLVESHVEAKRYLTLKTPGYYDSLSEASKKTLEFQGGRMSVDEAEAFEHYPLFHLIIQMREWDEAAKVENQPLPDLDKYKQLIVDHLQVK